jgi:hypothetical protein
MKAHLFSPGGTALAGSPDDYGKLIAEETEKWGKVVRAAGLKAWVARAGTSPHSPMTRRFSFFHRDGLATDVRLMIC